MKEQYRSFVTLFPYVMGASNDCGAPAKVSLSRWCDRYPTETARAEVLRHTLLHHENYWSLRPARSLQCLPLAVGLVIFREINPFATCVSRVPRTKMIGASSPAE